MCVVFHSPPADSPLAGTEVDIKAFGAAAGTNAQGSYFALGYSRETTVSLRDNVVVSGDPIAALNDEIQTKN